MKIEFVRTFKIFGGISLVLFIFSVIVLILRFNKQLGLEFTGGNLFYLGSSLRVPEISKALSNCGIKNFQIKSVFGEQTIILRTGLDISEKNLMDCFSEKIQVLSYESFSPTISGEIKRKGTLAGLLALIAMLIYLTVRFEKFFALGACLALIHDVIISLAIYILLGYSFTLQALVGVLTLIGYSVNDTIIVFDRIREELKNEDSLTEIFNRAINLSLARSLKTSFTTFLVVLLLIFLGKEAVVEFSVYFMIGILIGTYSSIFVAAPSTLYLISLFRRE
ncbi:MAG: protein translocase subunit SecF [Deltaproteobacteria bacterium]|nr:protein translocase subunit SecF [Deltaproteobacteria bacterium]